MSLCNFSGLQEDGRVGDAEGVRWRGEGHTSTEWEEGILVVRGNIESGRV